MQPKAGESWHPLSQASEVAVGLEVCYGVWSQGKSNRKGKFASGEVEGQEERQMVMGSICSRCHFAGKTELCGRSKTGPELVFSQAPGSRQ